MDIQCYVGRFGNVQVPPLPWVLDNISVEQYFAHASANSISLHLKPDQIARDITGGNPNPTADPYKLHKALNALFGKDYDDSPEFPLNTVGLIFADRCETIPGIFGLMFNAPFYTNDTPFRDTSRQGAAVFLNEIRDARKTDEAFHAQVMFDVIHEIGHMFNLWHTPNNSAPHSSTFLMSTSKSDRLYDPPYQFSPDQIVFLSQWSLGNNAKYVTPGLTAFRDRGSFSVREDDGEEDYPRNCGLRLTIRMMQEEFWQFEPVELDLRLEVVEEGLQVMVPNEIDPSYERFQIIITEPTGSVRLYNPPAVCCANKHQLTLTTANPFVRDITLFGQAGKYTFHEPGRYQIQALFFVYGTVLRSNIVEIVVIEPAIRDRFYRDASPVFRNQTIAEAMYYRHVPLDSRLLLPALEIGKRYPSTAAVAGFNYALGRGLLNRAGNRATPTDSAKDHQTGLAYLARALDSNKLLGHRATLAERLLQYSTNPYGYQV